MLDKVAKRVIDRHQLANLIKQQRERLNESQGSVARALGINQTMLSQFENEKIAFTMSHQLEAAEKLASLLDFKIPYLDTTGSILIKAGSAEAPAKQPPETIYPSIKLPEKKPAQPTPPAQTAMAAAFREANHPAGTPAPATTSVTKPQDDRRTEFARADAFASTEADDEMEATYACVDVLKTVKDKHMRRRIVRTLQLRFVEPDFPRPEGGHDRPVIGLRDGDDRR